MARHQPHLYLPGEWDDPKLELNPLHSRHLTRVLKVRPEDPISYTDGRGMFGRGRLGDDHVIRGEEQSIERPSTVAVAVAPVKSNDRMRFIVEKLQELGVMRLTWLVTDFGQAKPPREAKASGWVLAALEQSRGAWRMEIVDSTPVAEIENAVLADGDGKGTFDPDITLCIGPEGGWSPDELSSVSARISLGATVLRTETAAVVGASRAIYSSLVAGD